MATVGELLTEAAAALAEAGVADERREARLIMAHVLGADIATVFSRPERNLGQIEAGVFASLLARRVHREPWSRISGVREFWSLPFRLTADTLDPRPDSETLVQAVLDAIPDRAAPLRVLDLGTGSGCLLLALLSELSNAHGLGVDISPGAAAAAAANARNLALDGRAGFAVSDWGAALTGAFDIVAVNPPYIPDGEIVGLEPEVAEWDPKRALAGGTDGLDALRALLPDLVRLTAPEGIVAVELGAGQDRPVAEIAEGFGLAIIAESKDLNEVVRCLLMRKARVG